MTTDLRSLLQTHLASTYTLGPELGSGGMSHVFAADDTTLGRRVVVKVLRPELAEGLSAERFKREIRLAARLQHPHIVPLLAAGEVASHELGKLLYYSMPLIEGESLRSRLAREGNLPLGETVRILRDVAGALAYAHRQGIVHRDIKPENILLAEGGALVADFGIAKAIAVARDPADTHGGASTLTQRGTSVGTPAYMAPEQAAGDVVDHRADLYSLGVVAYEMLAGRAPFDARTAQQLMAAHATEAPVPVERRRNTVPPALASLVMQLLEKQPADRPQSSEFLVRSLDAIAAMLGSPTTPEGVAGTGSRGGLSLGSASIDYALHAPSETRRSWLRRAGVGALAALIVLTGLGWMWTARRDGADETRLRARFTLHLPPEADINIDGPGNTIALSPDGSRLAYVGGRHASIFIRPLDSLVPRELPNTALSSNPQFSPDGRWVAFLTRTAVRKVPASGGPSTIVANSIGRFTWTPAGGIVHTTNTAGFLRGLRHAPPGSTVSEPLTTGDSVLGGMHGSPTVLPDGNTVLFTTAHRSGSLMLAGTRLSDGKAQPLGIEGGGALFLAPDVLLFSRTDGSVAAVQFDPDRLRPIGDPVKVLDSVAVKSGGVAQIDVARNGTMAYLPGTIASQLVLLDRDGTARILLPEPRNYSNPRVSPDGRRIAVSIGHPPYISDIWIYDLRSQTFTRLTNNGWSDFADWSPDGRRLAWTTVGRQQDGIWWQPWDASAPPELLLPDARLPRFVPGRNALLASFQTPEGVEVRLVQLPLGSAPMQVVLPPSAAERQYRPSPDGRWLAFVSDETGTREVYVQPLPGPGGRHQVSSGGGIVPAWGTSNQEITYISSGCCLISARFTVTPEFVITRRDTLFSVQGDAHPVLQSRTAHDVMPGDREFVLVRRLSTVGRPVVVFNWGDEVRERLGLVRSRRR